MFIHYKYYTLLFIHSYIHFFLINCNPSSDWQEEPHAVVVLHGGFLGIDFTHIKFTNQTKNYTLQLQSDPLSCGWCHEFQVISFSPSEPLIPGVLQLQLFVRLLPCKQQHLSQTGPVSSRQGLQQKLHFLHGCVCPQRLHQRFGSHSWLYGHHSVSFNFQICILFILSILTGFLAYAFFSFFFFNRCISPDLKSLALGMQTLVTRTLGKFIILSYLASCRMRLPQFSLNLFCLQYSFISSGWPVTFITFITLWGISFAKLWLNANVAVIVTEFAW